VDDEEAMLSEAFLCKVQQPLHCQIPITESLEGLELELAPEKLISDVISLFLCFVN
jgi:2Fe-2S ferredoxin